MISINNIVSKIANQPIKSDQSDCAAILIPIVKDNNGELNLLFQVRSLQLRWQPGDICFPGGRIESNDASPIDAAIRETHEELGINKSSIQIYGQLPTLSSKLGLTIFPVIGELTSLHFNINPDEVYQLFTVPIDWFYKNPPIQSSIEVIHKPAPNFPFELVPQYKKEWQKKSEYDVFFYHYKEYVIWGLTAQILQSFLKILR